MRSRKIFYAGTLFVLSMTSSNTYVFAQKKLTESMFFRKFISSEIDTTRSSNFLVFPALGYSQETSFEYGLNGSLNFFADRKDSTIRSSTISAFATLTTNKQSNLKTKADIWTSGNKYHLMGEIRYRHYPFSFYGIGTNTREKDKDLLIQRLFRVDLESEKEIRPYYYTGLNVIYEHYKYEDKESGGLYDEYSYYGKQGGQYLAIGISQSYDKRNSVTYTTQGSFARGKLAYAPDLWGSENFTGGIIELDLRQFFTLNSKFTLGFNALYQTVLSKHIPFYLLPQLGNDEIMRGYYQGRYRDKHMLAIQTELRYRLHPRIGAAIFSSAGTVSPALDQIKSVKASFGGGLSYFFDLKHQSSVRLDYGFGEKRPGESRQSGFYISLGQAF